MAVIINDFEIVPESPATNPAGQTPPGGTAAPPAPALSPQDVQDVVRRQRERALRLRAH